MDGVRGRSPGDGMTALLPRRLVKPVGLSTIGTVLFRVSGAIDSFVHTGLAVSFLIGGPMVSAFGPRTVYIVGGVAAFAGAAVGIPLLRGVHSNGGGSEQTTTPAEGSVGPEPAELLRP